MLSQDKLDRINVLANKSKSEGLTLTEQKEQKKLREEYLKNVRKSFKNHLHSMKVVDPEGNDVTPQKLKEEQERNKKH
ncbi:hypothetical protein N781_11705 [Pontibacillus halophilus JSM 076056 = DSM 19796]|uniref:UPF0291 protein N781_11705 n=1 Tax=Pontibacillus halophilus JSM 076056 = DSM 19796 TaxID=1385510 RepID=A0A0A5GPB7_9BACI|nr:DUF896 domain-containing protein [Pontibacillus halophilus]KGX93078.1 hypothetical protein N781_11705 [Pontibacillus halophilus JSM 076056 = DSM 19796]